jgi:hypothetical protein
MRSNLFTGDFNGMQSLLRDLTGKLRETAIALAVRRNPFTGKCNVMQSEAIVTGFTGKISLRKLSQDFSEITESLPTLDFSRKHFNGISGPAITIQSV